MQTSLKDLSAVHGLRAKGKDEANFSISKSTFQPNKRGHPAAFDATTNLFIAERSRLHESGILIYSSETRHHLDRREKRETNHHAINCNCCKHLISS